MFIKLTWKNQLLVSGRNVLLKSAITFDFCRSSAPSQRHMEPVMRKVRGRTVANSQGETFYLPIYFTRTLACMLALGLALVMQGEKDAGERCISFTIFSPSHFSKALALSVLNQTCSASDFVTPSTKERFSG